MSLKLDLSMWVDVIYHVSSIFIDVTQPETWCFQDRHMLSLRGSSQIRSIGAWAFGKIGVVNERSREVTNLGDCAVFACLLSDTSRSTETLVHKPIPADETRTPMEIPSEAYHPLFSDPAADTVLRSADGILFRVPSFILRRTTGYFTATLPASTNAEAHEEPECSSTLARILCILCGLPSPIEDLDFDAAESTLALASRWDAPGVTARLRDAISGPAFLRAPLRLYALTARAGWADEAQAAARGTLGLGLYEAVHSEELKRVPSRDLLALLALHRRRRDVLDRILSGEKGEGEGVRILMGAVSGRCKACGLEADNWAWREFRARIFAEMDTRPLGDTVTGFGVDEWREAAACWSAKCAGAGCGKGIYDRETILREIKVCIETLPDTV
ncbi:hypothetical protein C8R44DRAFT_945432 [Mycena epipterygia]|nr:hypothetical protein C8R44DRAFT_945432 [Mycena epipterygia]